MPLARIHAPGEVRVDRVEMPDVGPRDVLVQVASCGICGSDLSYTKIGGLPGAPSPMPIGHEFSGTVAAVGEQVTGLAVGDRVVVNPEGADNGIGGLGGRGAFAPYVVFRDAARDLSGIIRLPESMTFEMGALVEPLSVGMHGLNRGRVTATDRLAIFGAGPIGLGAALVARYLGLEQIAVIDLSDFRLGVARELGLATCRADREDVAAFLKDTHGTVDNRLLGEQPATDVYLEATGVGSVFQQMIELGKQDARIVVLGVHFRPVELNLLRVLMTELQITASQAYPEEFPAVVEMLASGQVDIDPLVTHRFPLSDFNEALGMAQRQDRAIKVMVDCQR
jgi:2-desacetyl-2-hydroxyethyl bacteriochlorophyllide A dehydrogenase